MSAPLTTAVYFGRIAGMRLHLHIVAEHGRCGLDCPWLWTPPDDEPGTGFHCSLFEHDNGEREDGPHRLGACEGIIPGREGVTAE